MYISHICRNIKNVTRFIRVRDDHLEVCLYACEWHMLDAELMKLHFSTGSYTSL